MVLLEIGTIILLAKKALDHRVMIRAHLGRGIMNCKIKPICAVM